MTADPHQLRVFQKAGHLGALLYEVTQSFPMDDPYCLQSRIREASTSIPTHIVKGYGQAQQASFRAHILAAKKEASELRYLVDLAHRMGHLKDEAHRPLDQGCSELIRSLHDFLLAPDAEPLLHPGTTAVGE